VSSDQPREEDLFCAAAGIPEPAQRAAYLDQACGNDAALRQRIATRLRRHFETKSVLPAPPPGEAPTATSAPIVGTAGIVEQPGTRIGPYTLLEVLGEGGMGTVFMAEQTQPVKRRVALKIIKPGMDSRQVIARFEAERQALALLDHPHIAKVLDAGASAAEAARWKQQLDAAREAR
jgi:eukaryotic-like serine/threonine-protein kinase